MKIVQDFFLWEKLNRNDVFQNEIADDEELQTTALLQQKSIFFCLQSCAIASTATADVKHVGHEFHCLSFCVTASIGPLLLNVSYLRRARRQLGTLEVVSPVLMEMRTPAMRAAVQAQAYRKAS